MNQQQLPLFHALQQFQSKQPISFHVPGHKNGDVFLDEAKAIFDSILNIDMTELTGLDDLHAPDGIIALAEQLAMDFFQTKQTFFLVGGSTAGNIAMILAACREGDTVIVQRNCHKSVMNGLELSGAKPVFIAPIYDECLNRFTNPSIDVLEQAIKRYPNAKAIILTYPDYFGNTYDLQAMIELAHSFYIPVLVDEAHGVHFSLGDPFPSSALRLGADVVVQSAHKMAPAMTMSSFLHCNSERVLPKRIAHYLQMLQSSSPSYPLMASLDIARAFLANFTEEMIDKVLESVQKVKAVISDSRYWRILPSDDPLKITIQMEEGVAAKQVAHLFEQQQIFPELVTEKQILFVHGLAPFLSLHRLKKAVQTIVEQLKNIARHDTIETKYFFPVSIQELALSYQTMNRQATKYLSLKDAVGYIAAEAVIPYPPGIALILKGEKITTAHVEMIHKLRKMGVRMQQRSPNLIQVFTGTEEGEETK